MKIATGARWTFLADEELEVRGHFEIDEYTDTHHDYAVVPHTVILSPGLVIEKVYVGYWFWGRPSPEQLWIDLGEIHAADQGRLRPDAAGGALGLGVAARGRQRLDAAKASRFSTTRTSGPRS